MIATILIVSIALAWLGYETDGMRARLPVGAYPELIERKSWDELKPTSNLNRYPFWLRHPGNMAPICGWDWLEQTMHIVPEYKIELNTYGVRYQMTVKKDSVLSQVMKANKPTKQQRLAYAQ